MPSFTVFKGSKDGVVRAGTTTKPDQLVGDQVLLKVTASGLCGTDLHYKSADMVLGHEGVGVVEQVGPDVKFLQKGQRVGWGYETDSCERCIECLQGQDTFCEQRSMYGIHNPDQGSFATHAVWREAFLHPIPDGLTDDEAAPLQCGGATVFSALFNNTEPNDVVGILGMGGLGHLAVQFAAKLGCRVVVISGSKGKEAQAKKLGAHKFIAMKEPDHEKLEGDWLITKLLVTASAQPDWEQTLPLLAMRSHIYPMSVSSGNLAIPYMPLLVKGIRIQGCLVATRHVHREMLQFAAFHGIKPDIERFPMTEEGIKEAMTKLDEGKVHGRAVLLPQSA